MPVGPSLYVWRKLIMIAEKVRILTFFVGIIRKIANFSLRSTLAKHISLVSTDGKIHTFTYK